MNVGALAEIGLVHFLVLSAVLFTFGLLTVVTRRNAVAILMGIELILNAAAINFVAFAHFSHGTIVGQVFVVVMAAAEAAVALAIVLAVFRGFRSIDTTVTTTLKE